MRGLWPFLAWVLTVRAAVNPPGETDPIIEYGEVGLTVDSSNSTIQPPPAACSGAITTTVLLTNDSTTIITNPDYPHNYTRPCTMKVRVDAGCNTIQYQLADMDIKKTENCQEDSLSIYDYDSNRGGKIGKFCGKLIKPENSGQTIGGYLYIEFIAGNSTEQVENKKGFKITVQRKNYTEIELGEKHKKATIMNPGYWQGYYQRPCSYRWLIKTPPFYNIKYKAKKPKIYYSKACKDDSLKMYNSYSDLKDELINDICGISSKVQGESRDRYLYIEFNASNRTIMNPKMFPGFLMELKAQKTYDKFKGLLIATISVGVIASILFLIVCFGCVCCCIKRRSRYEPGLIVA